MNKSLKYLFFILAILILPKTGISVDNIDDGTNENGDMIIPQALRERCGLSSKNPNITDDCYKRLAYDSQRGNSPVFESFGEENLQNFEDLRNFITNDYTADYLKQAIQKMIASGEYDEHIGNLLCELETEDEAKKDCESYKDAQGNVNQDINTQQILHNKIATDNNSVMIDAIRIRSSMINLTNNSTMFDAIVPMYATENLSSECAKIPSSTEIGKCDTIPKKDKNNE